MFSWCVYLMLLFCFFARTSAWLVVIVSLEIVVASIVRHWFICLLGPRLGLICLLLLRLYVVSIVVHCLSFCSDLGLVCFRCCLTRRSLCWSGWICFHVFHVLCCLFSNSCYVFLFSLVVLWYMFYMFDFLLFVWSGWNCPAWRSGGQGPLIAGCCPSLQRLGGDLPVTRPVWDSNSRPPTSESRSLASLANCAFGATTDLGLSLCRSSSSDGSTPFEATAEDRFPFRCYPSHSNKLV